MIKYKQYENLDKIKLTKETRIIIAGASDPGHSSDANALFLAKFLNSKTIVSLKNVDGVYDKDPYKYKEAKYFKYLTWDEYKKNTW